MTADGMCMCSSPRSPSMQVLTTAPSPPLSTQVHVLLATPGRLLDFLEAGVARLDDVR
jgi:superfamily II DNA/RNA helicase